MYQSKLYFTSNISNGHTYNGRKKNLFFWHNDERILYYYTLLSYLTLEYILLKLLFYFKFIFLISGFFWHISKEKMSNVTSAVFLFDMKKHEYKKIWLKNTIKISIRKVIISKNSLVTCIKLKCTLFKTFQTTILQKKCSFHSTSTLIKESCDISTPIFNFHNTYFLNCYSVSTNKFNALILWLFLSVLKEKYMT